MFVPWRIARLCYILALYYRCQCVLGYPKITCVDANSNDNKLDTLIHVVIFFPFALYQVLCYEQYHAIETFFFIAISICGMLFIWITTEVVSDGEIEQHVLLNNGPYRYLVHPAWSSQYLCKFLIMSWLMLYPQLVAGYIVFSVLLMYNIHQLMEKIYKEEQLMHDYHGDKYIQHISGKYKLIPYIY